MEMNIQPHQCDMLRGIFIALVVQIDGLFRSMIIWNLITLFDFLGCTIILDHLCHPDFPKATLARVEE